MDTGSSSSSTYEWLTDMKWEDRGIYLARLLPNCAKLIESLDIMNAGSGLKNIAALASPDGDALQRVATYVNEGLTCRMIKNFHGVPEGLRLTNHLSASEKVFVRKLFFDFLPFLMFSYVIANEAIVEAIQGERVVHIIDLNACDPTQWLYLLHKLKEQHQGINNNYSSVPFLKITGIHENQEVLEQTKFELTEAAKKMNLSFDFHPVVSKLEDLNFEKLHLTAGEFLAISSILQLHTLLAIDDPMVTSRINHPAGIQKFMIKLSPDSSLSPPSHCASPKMEYFLNKLWKHQPKLMIITEQESNANGFTLKDRLDPTLNFYGALFDCLEANVPKVKSGERIILERMLLGEEIKNIISCEGSERKERHEKVETWIAWLELAGFRRVPISYERMLQATRPLQSYGRGYKLLRHNHCLFICWNDRPLYTISAWRF